MDHQLKNLDDNAFYQYHIQVNRRGEKIEKISPFFDGMEHSSSLQRLVANQIILNIIRNEHVPDLMDIPKSLIEYLKQAKKNIWGGGKPFTNFVDKYNENNKNK